MADRQQSKAGIYIHIPFCESKCAYCSFVSYAGKEEMISDYLQALEQEMAFYAQHPSIKDLSFESLFIGGGTPTVLSGKDLARLLETVNNRFQLAADAEITIECNPNTLDREKLSLLKNSGVNRLSIGAQSFNDTILNTIGRKHTARQAIEAVKAAKAAGFNNLNLDLICGLPGQKLHNLKNDIATALELEPEHLAVYQLSIESGTPFSLLAEQGKLNLPSENTVMVMTQFFEQELEDRGYKRYEISNYAIPGKESRHNLIYWHNGPYLGLGCAAVSYLDGTRIRNTGKPEHYIKKITTGQPAWIETESLPREASFRETVIMGLRLIDGVDLNELAARFAIDVHEYYKDILPSLLSRELVKIKKGRLRLSPKALPVANQILAELV